MKASFFLVFCSLLILESCKPSLPEEKFLNHFQVIGSHNSYKMAIDSILLDTLTQMGYDMKGLEYEHISIPEQLDLGLRNLEIDVYGDFYGGRYKHPKGLDMAPSHSPFNTDSAMNEPGFKVFHMIDVDFRSSCPTLAICLQQLKSWSDKNPGHFPIFITLEVKDDVIELPDTNKMGVPEKLAAATFHALDSVLISGLGRDKLLTPDMVRGDNKTLNEAVTQGNWPTLDQAKGRFLFILDDNGGKRDLYIAGHPSLKGRVMFVNIKAGAPESATLILNNPEDTLITSLVKQGYIIRTRADANTQEARDNDYSRFLEACQSGAQIITTDYYKPSRLFKSSYRIIFEDSTYLRANPVLKEAE
jgi:hypothetical protein